MNRQELIAAIKQQAYLEGDFILRSGKPSRYYLDKYLFETDPAILAELGRLLAARCTGRTELIAGAELGGVPLAAATSLAAGKRFVIVRSSRKEHGTARQIEGKLQAGQSVLLVEDVATTGGQVVKAARILQQAGAVVEKIVAVIDRQEGAGQNIASAGFVFESLLTKADLGIDA